MRHMECSVNACLVKMWMECGVSFEEKEVSCLGREEMECLGKRDGRSFIK